MAYPTLQKKRSLTPGAWAQGTREMMASRPDLIPSQPQLDMVGSTFSQGAGRTMAGTNAMALQGRDARLRGLGAAGAVGSRSYGNAWQPELAVGLSMPQAPPPPHRLYASAPSLFTTTVTPTASGRATAAGAAAERSRSLRADPEWQRAVANNAGALAGNGTPTVRIDTGGMNPKYARMSLDEMAGGDTRRAFRQRQAEQLGLAPIADRQAMITARAQGQRLTPQMAAMQREDPMLAAIMGRDPAAAATFATNRAQMEPEYMDRQARGMAMQALFGAIPGAADPVAASAAIPMAIRHLQPPRQIPGSGAGAVAGSATPIDRVRSYIQDPNDAIAFNEAYNGGDVNAMARIMRDNGVPEDEAVGILQGAAGNQYSSYQDPGGDAWLTRFLKDSLWGKPGRSPSRQRNGYPAGGMGFYVPPKS